MENIFLIGPRHSGKSSAGRALARLCEGSFIDLDELIAERTGKSPRILYTEGPEIFKKAEAAALAAVLALEPSGPRIIAAGGGVIDNPEAIALLEKTATILPVYLNVSAAIAWERISGNGGELPPFLNTENPRETHRELHERRAAACRILARLVIEGDGKNPEAIAREIWERTAGLHGADAGADLRPGGL
jgi:shikimate kinase